MRPFGSKRPSAERRIEICGSWFAIARNRFTILAHHRPTTAPIYRLQIDHTAVGSLVIEMQKPVFALTAHSSFLITHFHMHPRPLMRSVDGSLSLPQHTLPLVRTVGRLTAHGKLPSHGHTARRAHDPVIAITLVELRPFGSVVHLSAVEDDARLTDGPGAVGRKLTHAEHAVEAAARVGPAIYQIATAVVVPQRTGVNHATACNHADRLLPCARRVGRLHHEDTEVGVAPVNEELALMIANGRCPYALAVLRLVEQLLRLLLLQGMTYNRPVHQVLGMEHGQSRNAVERRGCQVVVVAHRNGIRVTVVGIEHRIGIRAVAIVRTPHLRHRTDKNKSENKKRNFSHHVLFF